MKNPVFLGTLVFFGLSIFVYAAYRGLGPSDSPQAHPIKSRHIEVDQPKPQLESTFEADQPHQVAPPYSGITVHALDLWRNPNSNIGKLITFDGKSIPTMGPVNVDNYSNWKFDKQFALASGEIGLRYSKDLSDDTYLFNVRAHPWTGYGASHVPEAEIVGQIAVEMNSSGLFPDSFELWDVEPKGTIEARSQRGFVVLIPLVHFWRYHQTGKDAEAPINVVVPPQVPSSTDIH